MKYETIALNTSFYHCNYIHFFRLYITKVRARRHVCGESHVVWLENTSRASQVFITLFH